MAGERLLGIDTGQRRIGLAISDPDRKIASPLATYERQSRDRDQSYFKRLVSEQGIGLLVIGLPVHMDGREGQKALEARRFGQWLGGLVQLPIIFWDERFTTVEAERAMLDAGLTHKQRRQRRDRLAAQIILQSYLDAGCPQTVPDPGPLLGD
jgi:putative Holliday junction resolvase